MPVSKKNLTETSSQIFQLEKYSGATTIRFLIYYNWSKCLKLWIFYEECVMSMYFNQEYFTSYWPWYPVGCIYSDWLRAGQSGIESRWGREFPPVQTGPGAHPASCKMGTGSFPGIKCGRGELLATHPLLVPRSWKNRAIPLPTLWATPRL